MKDLKELQTHMDTLEKEHGLLRVNLVFDDKSTEGVWATPADAESAVLLKSPRSHGTTAKVRLLNRALWGGVWGSLISVRTHGTSRPTATIPDQKADPEVVKDLEELCDLYLEHANQEDAAKAKSSSVSAER